MMADGEIRLTGRRIGLYHVLDASEQGEGPEAVVERFGLDPEHVRRVLSFAADRKVEVAAYMADYRTELDRIEAAHPPSPALLRMRRLMEQRNASAQVP